MNIKKVLDSVQQEAKDELDKEKGRKPTLKEKLTFMKNMRVNGLEMMKAAVCTAAVKKVRASALKDGLDPDEQEAAFWAGYNGEC